MAAWLSHEAGSVVAVAAEDDAAGSMMRGWMGWGRFLSNPQEVFLSIRRDHHYVPKFYLKRWALTDGQLCEYKRGRGRIHTRSTYPKGTGYERDLYRVEGLPDHLAHMVETKFMHWSILRPTMQSKKLLAAMKRRGTRRCAMPGLDLFLSLRFRNPEAVKNCIKEQMREVWKAGIENLRVNYETKRRPTDPPNI